MGLMFFVGGAYRLGFSYCLHAYDGDWASAVKIFVVYFNAQIFYSNGPEFQGEETGWAILEESQGDGAEETGSLTRTPWVTRGSTEAGQQARYLGKVWSGQGSYWGEP